jgi:pyridoxal phosphate enzyme (YggS family)
VSADLGARLARTQERINDACRAANRDPSEVTLITVTKFHPASLVRDLYDLGVRDIGENRDQEAYQKAQELSALDIRWHYIGQLQTNKAKNVAQYAHAIHSVDRSRLVHALDRAIDSHPRSRVLEAFVQVNLTDDPNRGGVGEGDLENLAERVLESPHLKLRGVMAVAPLDEHPTAAFARLAELSERVQALAPTAKAMSAGMSHDFAEAIQAGATHLRIGSEITGKRPEPK